jgi:aminobenzoyl-glutamate utilization protein B
MIRFAILALAGGVLFAASPEERRQLLARMDAEAAHYGQISRQMWEFAEVGYQETKSAGLLMVELEKNGFTIERNIGGIPTAFTATWGSGRPVIGIMREFDALPGLAQDAVPGRKPVLNGAPGHGGGHNLFGTAQAWAAIQAKQYLEARKRPGTIRFFGTPAEEGGGKISSNRYDAPYGPLPPSRLELEELLVSAETHPKASVEPVL